MSNLIARARVILGSLVTYLVLLAAVIAAAAGPIVEAVGVDSPVAKIVATVLGVLAVAIEVVRRVTQVLPDARGVLPVPDDQPVTAQERWLMHELETVRNLHP